MYLRQRVKVLLEQAVSELKIEEHWPADLTVIPDVEHPASPEHGDYSTNLAMKLAKPLRQSPRAIAEKLKAKLESQGKDLWDGVEVAGPGFVNLHLNPAVLAAEVGRVRQGGEAYGQDTWGQGRKLLLEFVSANPTGPLNIVSARAASVGDALARILRSQGVAVDTEYYINDAGNQALLLGESLAARWKQSQGREASLPEEGYQGEYITDLAQEIARENTEAINRMLAGPGPDADLLAFFKNKGVEKIVGWHKLALADFGVTFTRWFHEIDLVMPPQGSGIQPVETVVAQLKDLGFLYEKDQATWFRSTDFKDDKDRVLIKNDGTKTYLTTDIAYHVYKFARGYTELIDIWGPDHHGYIARMQAAMLALKHPGDAFHVLIAQQVNLLENGAPVAMSKRAGVFITMADLIKDVGRDVARFFFLMRSTDAHLDFDLDLARKHTDENPVFYVQYAHARICSILAKAREEQWTVPAPGNGPALFEPMVPEELAVVRSLTAFPEIVEAAARNLEPHTVAFYLRDLATEFHRFYTLCRVLDPEARERSQARLALIDAIRIVLRNGLDLLGISAPEKM
ncbi:MAG: arginine--tRNA ligase [Candidatus Firestonebacteria bacterium]|nr:arginine--tRNA ligase [Candidatus Firestonebacteria bacterium]